MMVRKIGCKSVLKKVKAVQRPRKVIYVYGLGRKLEGLQTHEWKGGL